MYFTFTFGIPHNIWGQFYEIFKKDLDMFLAGKCFSRRDETLRKMKTEGRHTIIFDVESGSKKILERNKSHGNGPSLQSRDA